MTFKNPLNHFRGAELKAPIFQQQALQAKRVRAHLLAHPEGQNRAEITAALGDIGDSLHYLRKRRFARMVPWNHGANQRKTDLWLASEPGDPHWEERRKRLGY